MGKRTYLFADRATAEDECRRQASRASNYGRMLTGMIDGSAIRVRNGGYYDAYYVAGGCPEAGLVMIVYHRHDLHQKPVVNVYTLGEAKDWYSSLARRPVGMGQEPTSRDSEQRCLHDLLGKVLFAMTEGDTPALTTAIT